MTLTAELATTSKDLEVRRQQENTSASLTPDQTGDQGSGLFGRLFSGAPGEPPSDSAARFLGNSNFSSSINSGQRVVSLKAAQQTHGNRFAQRLFSQVQRKPAASRFVQRQCACSGTCEKCSATPVQASAVGSPSFSTAPLFIQARAADSMGMAETPDEGLIPTGGGEPIDERTRRMMESRFERDFGDVRVHTDESADRAAKELNADAFTSGRDIYFAAGQYAPESAQGQHLLAHELTHTVQQSEGVAPTGPAMQAHNGLLVGRADDPLEQEADRTADAIVGFSQSSAHSLTADRAPAIRRGLRDRLRGAWDATGGRAISAVESGAEWVGEKVGEGVEAIREWAMARIEEYAPGLLELLRGDVIGFLKDNITGALDGVFGGFVARIQREGLVGALEGVIGDLIGSVSKTLGPLVARGCDAIARAAQSLFDVARNIGGEAFDALKQGAQAIGGFLSDLWRKLGAPAWEAIKGAATSAWAWIEAKATWVWEQTAPVRRWFARAWSWLKQQFNLAWDSGAGILDWFKQKAIAAWDRIKGVIQPILGPLKVIGAIFVLLSPLGPIVLIWKAAPAIWNALKWVWENWDKADIIVRARTILRDQILPAILSGVNRVSAMLGEAAAWIVEKTQALTAALGQLADALGVTTFLRTAQQAVSFLAEKVSKLASWAATKFLRLVEIVKDVLQKVWEFVQPILVVLVKLSIVIANPWLWPIYLSALAWKILPDCLKPPIIDFVLDLMIGALRAMPDFKFFGETWARVKQSMIQTLVDVRQGSTERKIEITNRIAEMIVGGSLEGYGNLFAAAKQVPDHFVGQVQEELIGMDLGQPLPFERRAEPESRPEMISSVTAAVETGEMSPENAQVLTRITHSEGDVGVTHVSEMDLSPEFIDSLNLREGEEREFGHNEDPANSMEALQAEQANGVDSGATVAGPSSAGTESPVTTSAEDPSTAGGSPAAAATTGAPPIAESGMLPQTEPVSVDQQLDQLIANQPSPPCTRERPAEGPAAQSDIPEHLKIGPLTPSQRGRYMWEQMKKGIKGWYECNRTTILVSLAVALVVLIVAAILTGGAILEALPVIMEIIGAIMIGVAIVRVAAYVAEYIWKAFSGDVTGAAKSLARGLAVGAIELVFALLFNIGAVIKSMRAGLTASLRAVGRSATKLATGTVRNVRRLGQIGVKAGTRLATNLRRAGSVFVRNGKIMMQGLERGFSRGVRSLEDLAKRLWARLRFRKFKLRRSGRRFQLLGYINPWVLLADGSIEWVENSQIIKSAASGEAVTARRTTGELIEGLLVRGTRARPDYRQIADLFFKETVSHTNVIHHAIEQQVLKRFPGLFALHEVHGAVNLRTIIRGAFNSEVHLSKIRILWNDFYLALERAGLGQDAARAAFRNYTAYIDGYIDAMKTFMANSEEVAKALAASDTAALRDLLERESLRLLSTPAMNSGAAIRAALGK